MKLTVNGVEKELPDAMTVAGLLVHLGINVQRVAVELNRDICTRSAWDATALKDGDSIEIVTFVGGG